MKIWSWWTQKKDKTPESNHRDRKRISSFSKSVEYQIADHLVVMRLGSSHHGIYTGNNHIVFLNYYSGVVVEDALESFAQGSEIKVIYSPVMYRNSTIISRCKSRIGERDLQGFMNRSEGFARWARCGDIW